MKSLFLLFVMITVMLTSTSYSYWIRLEVNGSNPYAYYGINHPGASQWKCDYLSVGAHGQTECRDQVNGQNRYFLQRSVWYSEEGSIPFNVYNGTGELKFTTELFDLQDQGFLRTIFRDIP